MTTVLFRDPHDSSGGGGKYGVGAGPATLYYGSSNTLVVTAPPGAGALAYDVEVTDPNGVTGWKLVQSMTGAGSVGLPGPLGLVRINTTSGNASGWSASI